MKLEYATPANPPGRLAVSRSAGDLIVTMKPLGSEAVRGLVRAVCFCLAAVSLNALAAAVLGALAMLLGARSGGGDARSWLVILILMAGGLGTGFLCLLVSENLAVVSVRIGADGTLSRTPFGGFWFHRTVWNRGQVAGVSARDGRVRLRLRDGRLVRLLPRFLPDEHEELDEVVSAVEAWMADKMGRGANP